MGSNNAERIPRGAAARASAGWEAFLGRIGHRFRRPELLVEALTHPSAAAAKRAEPSYERLEFLGDRVLGLVVADLLLRRYPHEAEGPLARRQADLVRRETLARVAAELDLGPHLGLDKGTEMAGERDNPAILADACEAVIGALYLDGGLEAARAFIESRWIPLLESAAAPPQDDKTALQEWAQGRGLPLPEYREVGREGPPHEPLFTVEVQVRGYEPARGTGRSKRLAEQAAAGALLVRVTREASGDGP